MRYEKVKPYIKWGIYYLALLLLFALQTTPGLFSIAQVKPVFVVPFMVCICMFEDIVPSAIFSMITGLLWDVTSDKLLGFNAIILLCFGLLISLLFVYYLHTKLINSAIFCLAVLLLQGLLDYFFHFIIWDTQGAFDIFLLQIIPSAFYSIAFVVPFYYLVRSISNRFNEVTRV